MTVSIIVPFKNEELYIRDCIVSLYRQSYKRNVEIIFVNNDSTDKSVSIVKEYKDIVLINSSGGNEYTARNKALKKATGRILVFIDADCVAESSWLNNITKPIRKGSDIALGKREYPHSSSSALKIFEKYENYKAEKVVNEKLTRKYFGYANNMAISRKVLNVTKGFKEFPVNGDTQVIYDYISKTGTIKISYVKNATITHQEITSSSVWLKKLYSYGRQNTLYAEINPSYEPLSFSDRISFIFEKHIPLKEKLICIPILILGSLVYNFGETSIKWRNIKSL